MLGFSDSKSGMVAGFAMYENAYTINPQARRNDYLNNANMLVAWREQHDAVQPAFTPSGGVLSGEVDRVKLMKIMTPTVWLKFRGNNAWKFTNDYLTSASPVKGKAVGSYNWGLFFDRWAPILHSFTSAYRLGRGAMWPMPSPDPTKP